MKKCPSCGKSISQYVSVCPNCKADLTQKKDVVELDEITNTPAERATTTWKLDWKAIVAVLCTIAVLIGIMYISQPLHGDNKIAYDLISNSSYFQNARNIEALSGSDGSNENGHKHATLTIVYTDSWGNRKEGHYRINEDGVTDIQRAMDEAKDVSENTKGGTTKDVLAVQQANLYYQIYSNLLNVSKWDDDLDYEKITELLNK